MLKKILIGVFTAPGEKYEARRQMCRETWLRSIDSYPNLEYYWVYGGESEPSLTWKVDEHSRELRTPCQEGYKQLPQKTRRWFQWCCGNKQFDYAFKCDDDTYCDLHRLAHFAGTGDYIGQAYNTPAYASGGGGYLLSRPAAECVRDKMIDRLGDEDLIAGGHLRRNGFSLCGDSRFNGFAGVNNRKPTRSNGDITAHGIGEADFRTLHAEMTELTGLRLWMPFGDGLYRRAGEISAAQLARYWPTHPPLDITHFGMFPQVPNATRTLGMGNNRPWRSVALDYLAAVQEDFVLLLLDDYAVSRPVDQRIITVGMDYMKANAGAASYALAWNPTTYKPIGNGTAILQPYHYTLNLQACIWRRKTLIDLLRANPVDSIWELEQAMSRNMPEELHAASWDIPRPANADGCVDKVDKSRWGIAYNNICHQRVWEPRWVKWLAEQGHQI